MRKNVFKKPIEPNISNGFCLQLSSKLFGCAEIELSCLFKLRLIEYKRNDLKLSQLFLIQLINFHTFSYTRLWSVVFWKLYIFSIRGTRSWSMSTQNLSMQWQYLSIKIRLSNICYYWTFNRYLISIVSHTAFKDVWILP